MRARAGLVVTLAVAAGLLAGCAGRRIEGGVFHSDKGYRVTIPGPPWTVVPSSPADVELRHAGAEAGMLASSACGPAARRPADRLERQLLLGLRRRTVVEHGRASVGGHPARHVVLEAVSPPATTPLRIEAYVVSDGHCVYDLVYAAPPERFAEGREDFRRFVASFATE